MKILFILKKRKDYNIEAASRLSSGLSNSVTFLEQMLLSLNVPTKIMEVIDNNDIDREVHAYNPNIVVIEGLWVIPEKFDVLCKLYPGIQWIVRIHSEIPFLAMEGIAIDWIRKYIKHKNVSVGANRYRTVCNLREFLGEPSKILYLPNYYPVLDTNLVTDVTDSKSLLLNVGCFGAIRPLKNQLLQAMAAIVFAKKHHKILNFHVNLGRSEQGGENNLKNIRALFDGTSNHLVCHPWLPHIDFRHLFSEIPIDISMNVSFSETFCIVAADSVVNNVPIVASKDIHWLAEPCKVDSPTDLDNIVEVMERITHFEYKRALIRENKIHLAEYGEKSKKYWLENLESLNTVEF